jgi:hypothetical protein
MITNRPIWQTSVANVKQIGSEMLGEQGFNTPQAIAYLEALAGKPQQDQEVENFQDPNKAKIVAPPQQQQQSVPLRQSAADFIWDPKTQSFQPVKK